MDFAAAAALPLAGAAGAVDIVDPQPGQVVLVNGATGGVGRYAVQMLAARGATVVVTGAAADALIALGAKTVDYTTGSVVDQVRTAYPDGVDALINLVGHTAEDVPLDPVRANGTVATTTMAPDADTLAAAGLTGAMVQAHLLRETTAPLAEQAAAGALSIDVHTLLSLDQAVEGLDPLSAGTARGNIVVAVSD